MFVHEDNNPTIVWEQFCEYLAEGDYRSAIELTGNRLEETSDDFDDSIEGLMITKISESFDANVIMEPKINGTGAWQSVKITHIDMNLLMQKLLAGIMKETTDYEWNHGSYKNNKKISEAVRTSLSNQLNDDLSDCLVTDVIKVEFRYKDGKWILVMSKALYNAITGNATESSESVDRFFEEYSAQNKAKAN